MYKFLAVVLCFTSVFATATEPPKIEICKASIVKNGERMYLGHSLFEVGNDRSDTKTLFNYESSFDSPVTYTFKFDEPLAGKLWLSCAYNGERGSVVEQTAVKFKPKKCIEKMYPDQSNRVQSFQCER